MNRNSYNPEGTKRRLHSSPLLDAANDFSRKIRPTQDEVDAFKEMFYTLALRSNSDENRELSLVLSKSIYTPRSIAIFYAMDRIEAATPMLLNSKILSARDLERIILRESISYAKVIAQRKSLTPSTVNVLLSIDNSEREILKLLSRNEHLRDSYVIQKIISSAELHFPISFSNSSKTDDQPSDLHFNLLETEGTKDLSGTLMQLASKGGKLGRASAKTASVKNRLLSETHAQLLRTSKYFNHEAFAHCVQQACSLPSQTTVDALINKNTGFLAALLRALEVPKLKASRIMLMIAPDVGRSLQVFRLVSDRYEALKEDDCIKYLEKLGADFGGQKRKAQNVDPASRRARESRNTMPTAATATNTADNEIHNAPRVANSR